MQFRIDRRGDDKITSYVVDFGQAEKAVKAVVSTVGEALKATFMREVYIKKEDTEK